MYWREWSPKKNLRQGLMVPLHILDEIIKSSRDPGYESVYCFAEQDALAIKAAGSSQGFKQFPVGSDRIIIDLDDGENTLGALQDKLLSLRVGFAVWSSGGKGFHVVIPHKFIFHQHLPYSQFCWVRDLNFGEFDDSVFRHSSLISLPGRIHETTKRKKRLLEIWEGDMPDFEIVEPPEKAYAPQPSSETALATGLHQLVNLAMLEPAPGKRHPRVWACAKSLSDSGISFESALELLQAINNQWKNPKTSEEIIRAVQQAYLITNSVKNS